LAEGSHENVGCWGGGKGEWIMIKDLVACDIKIIKILVLKCFGVDFYSQANYSHPNVEVFSF